MKFNIELEGKNIEVDDRNLAEQANGNILIRCGDTTVLSTCTMSKEDREGLDFFPLTTEYEERLYAAGRIKGSRFLKREGRATDDNICISRLIDRAIRPRFDQGMKRDVQVISTVLSWDGENASDVLGILGASIALSISDIPWHGPIATVRVAKKDGEFILNPTYSQMDEAELDVVFAAILKGDEVLINMIEGGANEASEKDVEDALALAIEPLRKLVKFQEEIKAKIGKEKVEIPKAEKDEELEKEITEFIGDKLDKAIFQKDKTKRSDDLRILEKETKVFLEEKYPENPRGKYVQNFFEEEVNRIIHENVIKYDKRADGRKLDEVREIKAEVGVLPRVHGSGLFQRGKTTGLSVLTLGSPRDQQLVESLGGEYEKRFMHHYNFPPYSVGEVRPMRGPGRREIGHGSLAEKALVPLLPSFEDFPYTIRVVSEMLSSNGSTSMAAVSGSSLALMDGGVPIKRLATGIAIGLAQDEETGDYKIMTDIQGPEDHHGDMDFKIAGTREGITAIQLDIKVAGISTKIVKEALKRGKTAREGILDTMEKAIKEPREKLSAFAPKIATIKIDPEKIGGVIGAGGKIIKEIIEKTGSDVNVEDSGMIFLTSDNEESIKKAKAWIEGIVKEVEVGEIYEGTVKKTLDFGAFVEILPGQEALVHISKLADKRVENVEDIVKVGDEVTVKVIKIDDRGRIDLALIKNKSK